MFKDSEVSKHIENIEPVNDKPPIFDKGLLKESKDFWDMLFESSNEDKDTILSKEELDAENNPGLEYRGVIREASLKEARDFWDTLYSASKEGKDVTITCEDNVPNPENQNPPDMQLLEEVKYKTDDNGNIYCIDGKLQPNTTYELNGNIYTTDENGRIISCEATPKRTPENPRETVAQRQAGGEDRKESDQGGHIVGRDLSGDAGIGNLLAMDSKINQSDYKRMENDVKDSLDEGKDVTTKTEVTYNGDSERPDRITVTVTADGKDTIYKFDNNLDGSLEKDVPENGKEMVQDKLDETGGEISSIKEEYDENGNLVETTVYITYKGEDGANYRTNVVIENK